MANLNDINKDYENGFDCNTDVQFDEGELTIYIADRVSVTVQNIETKGEAIKFAEKLLGMWGFSYRLEFKNIEEAYQFFETK